MADPFKVSVYIPSYNVGGYLPLCLEHLFKQTRKPDEVIVVDDGSTDDTLLKACKFPVKIVRHQFNRGLSAARNSGIQAAQYELVGSLDADTLPHELWLEKLLAYFQFPNIAMASGMLVETYNTKVADLWRTTHMFQHFGYSFVQNPAFIFGNNNIVRKSVALEIGGYSERFRTNFEDADFSMRVRARGYETVYDPQAAVAHLRQDTLKSVLITSWKWRCYAYTAPVTFLNNLKAIIQNFLLIKRFVKEDWKEKKYKLIPLNITYFFAATWLDFKMWLRVKFLGKKAY